MGNDNIFTQKLDFKYKEDLLVTNYLEFQKVLKNRRSVRVFKDEVIDEQVIDNALRDGMLAPNSSNLQPWSFITVSNIETKKELAKYCFSQNGATTASELIVCIANTHSWKEHCKKMLIELKKDQDPLPKAVELYYKKLAPMAYGLMGPYGILSPIKWLLLNILGLTKVMVRDPIWPSQLKTWAVKSTALACENIMLSLSAQGYDSLPMEGFDSRRVKKMLKLKSSEHIVMIIAAGKRADNGVYGPQFRFDYKQFIKRI